MCWFQGGGRVARVTLEPFSANHSKSSKKTTGQWFKEGAYLRDRRQWHNQAPMPERPVVLPPVRKGITVSNTFQYAIERQCAIERQFDVEGNVLQVHPPPQNDGCNTWSRVRS